MTDEELQNRIEKGFPGKDLDARAYRTVFDALQKEPPFKLSAQFSDQVIGRVESVSQQSKSHEMVWLYLGLASFVIAAVVAIAMTGFKFNFGALKFISGYRGLFVFAAIFVLALQWIDKKLIHRPEEIN